MSDIIDMLAGIMPGSRWQALRDTRGEARRNAQRSFEALLEPADAGTFTLSERYAVAAYTTVLQAPGSAPATFYAEILAEETEQDHADAVLALARSASVPGPYGTYREIGLSSESIPGPFIYYEDEIASGVTPRLAAALEYSHLLSLHPRDAGPAALRRLEEAGWQADDIVTLSQLVAFLSFQLRVALGLAALSGTSPQFQDADPASADFPGWGSFSSLPSAPRGQETAPPDSSGSRPDSSSLVRDYTGTEIQSPEGFTQQTLGWVPWLAPIPEDELSEPQRAALIDEFRIKRPYFRLLVRDAEALEARTLTDKDIFGNDDGGLPLADREIAATAVSRVNGCVYCASVHSRKAAGYTGRAEEIQRLLDDGIGADLDPRWSAVAKAAAALTEVPSRFDAELITGLRNHSNPAGPALDDAELLDLIYSAAFFNWANRLMLALGEPEVPSTRRR